LYNNVFRPIGSPRQYLSAGEREKLIHDYIRARDGYLKAVVESRLAYEELVKRGWISGDNEKSEQ
jgi:hypothetical protein